MPQDDKIQALYNDVKKDYDVGTIDDFKNYLKDDTKRGAFYRDVIAPNYDVKSQDEFENTYDLKKKGQSAATTTSSDNGGTKSGSEAQSTSKNKSANDELLDNIKSQTSRSRLENITASTQKAFDSNPIFDDAKNRDVFYNNLKNNQHYSDAEINVIKVALGDNEGDASSGVRQNNYQYAKDVRNHPDEVKKRELEQSQQNAAQLVDFGKQQLLSDPAINIANSTIQGTKAGAQKMSETGDVYKKEGALSAIGNLLVGAGESTLALLTPVSPELTMWHLGTGAVDEKVEGASEYLSPFEKVLGDKYKEAGLPIPKWKENGAIALDFALQIIGFKKGEKYVAALKDGKIPEYDWKLATDEINNSSAEQIDAAIKPLVNQHELVNNQTQQANLKTDIANNPETAAAITPKLSALQQAHDLLNTEIGNHEITEAQKQTHLQIYGDAINELESKKADLSDDGKKAIDDQINTFKDKMAAIVNSNIKPLKDINDLAQRISKGEKIESPEDLQLQQNYPKDIEGALKDIQDAELEKQSDAKPADTKVAESNNGKRVSGEVTDNKDVSTNDETAKSEKETAVITDESYKDIPSKKITLKDGTSYVHEDTNDDGSKHLFISRIDVGDKGKGVGSELLKNIEEYAKKQGLKEVATIPETDASKKFFEKNGYIEGEDGVLRKDISSPQVSKEGDVVKNVGEKTGKEIEPIKSETPLKDEYKNRLDNLDGNSKQTDVSKLEVGDYVNIPKTEKSGGLKGFVKKISRKNITIETPYGGMGGDDVDYKSIQEHIVPKENVKEFVKPKQSTPAEGTSLKDNAKETNDPILKRVGQNLSKFGGKAVTVLKNGNETLSKIAEILGLDQKADIMKQVTDLYHGSPHDFEKFDKSKIGTGEGASAFGYGLYFTDLKDIAEGYAKKLSDTSIKKISIGLWDVYKDEQNIGYDTAKTETQKRLAEEIGINQWKIQKAFEDGQPVEPVIKGIIKDFIDFSKEEIKLNPKDADYHNKAIKEAEQLMNKSIKTSLDRNANLYKVALHEGKTPDQYDFIEWDKKITDNQKTKLSKLLPENAKWMVDVEYPKHIKKNISLPEGEGNRIDYNGQDLYKNLSQYFGGDKEASDFLLKAGIDGIKYPAESMSRGATSDNSRGSNYVVFDDKAITIKDKIKFMMNPKGDILGFTHDGKIYLNGEHLNPETTLHEAAGHLVMDWYEKNNPDIHARGIELIQGTKYLKDTLSNEHYIAEADRQGLKGAERTRYFEKEALAQAIGDNGAKMITEAKKQGIKDWLNNLWKAVAEHFGIRDMKPADLAKLSLEEFAKKVNADLLHDDNPDLKSSAKEDNPDEETKPDLSEKEKAAKRVEDARKAFRDKIGGTLSSGIPLHAIPEFIELVKAHLNEGVVNIKEFIKHFREDAPKSKLTDEEIEHHVNEVLREKNDEEEGFIREQGKKSLAGRVYEGKNASEIKDAVEQHGLNYDIESHEQAERMANDFINDVGVDNALAAVRNHEVEGGAASYIFAKAIDNIHNEFLLETDPTKKADLADKEANLISEFDDRARTSGQFISALNPIYQVSDLGYKLGTMLQRMRDAYGDENLPAALKQKIMDISDKLEDVNKKLAESEVKRKEAEANQSVTNIKEDVKRRKSSGKTRNKDVAERLLKANKEDDSKEADLIFESAKRDAVVARVADLMKKDPKESIKGAVEKIASDEAWTEEKTKKITDYLEDKAKKTEPVTDGKLQIPHSLLRELVEGGIDNIDDLVTALKEHYPDASERDIRDTVTGYGKTANPNMEEIETQIRKMKRIGRITSALEDIANKKRPLKSGLQRDKLDAEERKLNKELREAMKDLPQDATANARQLKNAQDRITSHLKNRIEDLERQIEAGEKDAPNKPIEYNEENKALKEQAAHLKSVLDDLVGDKELSKEDRIKRAINAVERSEAEYDKRIKNKEFTPAKKEELSSPELDAAKAKRDAKKEEFEKLKESQKNPMQKLLDSVQKTIDGIGKEKSEGVKKSDEQIAKEKALTKEQISNLPEHNKLDIQKLVDKVYQQTEDIGKAEKEGGDKKSIEQLKKERDITKGQIGDLIKEANKRNIDPEQKKHDIALKAIENSIDKINQEIADLQKGIEKKQNPKIQDAAIDAAKKRRDEAKAILDKMKDDLGITQAKKLQAVKDAIKKRNAELERRIKEQDFAKKEPSKPIMDEETKKLKLEQNKLKDEYDAELKKMQYRNRTQPEKIRDTLLKWRRFALLSGTKVLGKLTSAAVMRQFVVSPTEEVIGGIWSKIPVLDRIAAKAPREGGFNAAAEAKSFAEAFKAATYADIWETAKTGRSELDVLYGRGKKLPPEALDFFGQFHSALKVLPKRGEFERSLEKRSQWAIENGLDVKDPMVQMEIGAASYEDALRSIFMNDNAVTSGYQGFLKILDAKGAKDVSTAMQLLLPIVKVPTNFISETFRYIPGIGALKSAWVLRRGIENLTPQQADLVMRTFKKQTVGAALMLLGYYNANSIGGYYAQGDKRKEGDVKFGDIKILGLEVPHWLLHNPAMEMLQFGATIRRWQDKYALQGKDNGFARGLGEAAAGVAKQQPFISESMRASDALARGGGFGKFGADMTKSLVEPQLLQEAAQYTDSEKDRKPTGFKENLEMGIPGLRQNVPTKEEYDLQKMQKSTSDQTAKKEDVTIKIKDEQKKLDSHIAEVKTQTDAIEYGLKSGEILKKPLTLTDGEHKFKLVEDGKFDYQRYEEWKKHMENKTKSMQEKLSLSNVATKIQDSISDSLKKAQETPIMKIRNGQ